MRHKQFIDDNDPILKPIPPTEAEDNQPIETPPFYEDDQPNEAPPFDEYTTAPWHKNPVVWIAIVSLLIAIIALGMYMRKRKFDF